MRAQLSADVTGVEPTPLRPVRAAPSLVCFTCTEAMAPHQPVAYLDTGAVVHLRCRMASHGAAGKTVAIVQPSAHAMQLHVREARVAASASRAMQRSLGAAAGPAGATVDPRPGF